MTDVKTRLRLYLEHTPEVTLEEIMARTAQAPADGERVPQRIWTCPRRSLGPLAVAAISAVAVLVLIGGVLFLLRPTSEQEPSAPVPPPAPTAVPEQEPSVPVPEASLVPEPEPPVTETPIASAQPSVMSWSRLPADVEVFGGDGWQMMNDVTAGGPGFLAVGRDDSGGDMDGAVWYSTDGTDWQRVAHDEAVFGGDGNQQILAVTAGGPGFVAVGSDGGDPRRFPKTSDSRMAGFGMFEGAGTAAAVWVSVDGITWSRVPHDPEAFGSEGFGSEGFEWMAAVTAGGPGVVAVGAHYELIGESVRGNPLHEANLDGDAAVWTSTDGVTWRRVTDPAKAFSGIGWQEMYGVATGGSGLVAVGRESFETLTPLDRDGMHVIDPGALTTAAVWTSPDGVTWRRVPQDRELFGHIAVSDSANGSAWMSDVISGGPGFVAVGGNVAGRFTWGEGTATMWLSADGVEWSRIVTEWVFPTYGSSAEAIVDLGERLVAVGFDDSSGPANVWYSTDGGQSFTERPYDCEVFGPYDMNQGTGRCSEAPNFMKAVVATDTGVVVAVGTHAFDAAVWIGTWNTAGD